MKYFFSLLFILHGLISNSQNYNLTLTITNIKNIKGEIKIAVFNNKYTFPHKKEEYKIFTIPVVSNSEVYTIKDLPKGEYAIALFHDKNSDGKCNTDILGIPEEAYGFSKNFKPKLFAPSFNDCKVDLTYNMPITIKLIQ